MKKILFITIAALLIHYINCFSDTIRIPADQPTMQALIGWELSNLFVVEVR